MHTFLCCGKMRPLRSSRSAKAQQSLALDTPIAVENNTIIDQPQVSTPVSKDPNHTESEKHLKLSVKSLRPQRATDDPHDRIEINLVNTDLANLLQWAESLYKVSFLTGDSLDPKVPGKVSGNIFTFKTQIPLTKAQAWDLLLDYLDLANLTLVPESYEDNYPIFFRVTPSKDANQSPIPAMIGVDWQTLPDNSTKIRYGYMVRNTDINALYNIINDLKSKNGLVLKIDPLKTLLIIDTSANIKSLMTIVSTLDSAELPEALSVLKLTHADATDVKNLFDALIPAEDKGTGVTARLFGVKKAPTALYFKERPTIIAEPRSNALILLGTREAIEKVESFVVAHVDTELAQPYSPLYVYDLQYANASDVATILQQVTAPLGTTASTYGGVRDGDKFFKPLTITAEPAGNRLLIKAEKEDYLKIKETIKALDVKQPQVAIEVLIVNVTASDNRELGTQLRNKTPDTFSRNVAFQTSGVTNVSADTNINNPQGIIVDCNGGLMGNLVALAQGQQPGATIISLGSNIVGGVWALFKALQTHVNTNVVSHPFLVTTNKYSSQVSLGETRRVLTGKVFGGGSLTDTLGDMEANLTVQITPQINSSGIIKLQINISVDNFINTNDPTSANKNTKTINTTANVANGEILAIGGLLKKRLDDTVNRVPLLGDIPIIGWFFKDRVKAKQKDNLLIFISPQIVEPYMAGGMNEYTVNKADYSRCTMASMEPRGMNRDPINRWFFKSTSQEDIRHFNDFVNKTHSAESVDVSQSCYYRNVLPDCQEAPYSCNPSYNPAGDTIPSPTPTLTASTEGKKRPLRSFFANNQEINT